LPAAFPLEFSLTSLIDTDLDESAKKDEDTVTVFVSLSLLGFPDEAVETSLPSTNKWPATLPPEPRSAATVPEMKTRSPFTKR